MMDEILNIIKGEDKKNPLTDLSIAKMIGIRREKVIELRCNHGIPDSRERRKESIIQEAMLILSRNENISERKFTELLQKAGYKISRYTAGKLQKEVTKKYSAEIEDHRKNDFLSEQTAKLDYSGNNKKKESEAFNHIIGYQSGLRVQINQAKAAMLYPPHGLNTLIIGPSGVGKSYLAENMYKFAVESSILSATAPFVVFNCADYADNPQLLLTQLFGYVKGAFSGADATKFGLIEKANQGILFLDEVHRLPSEGQEILFSILDRGEFRRLGETSVRRINVRIIAATTENIESSLLLTFRRRIPMIIDIPILSERSAKERYEIIKKIFTSEAAQTKQLIKVDTAVIKYLMLYKCPGNIGQLFSDIKVACANAFLVSVSSGNAEITVRAQDLMKYENFNTLENTNRVEIEKYIKNPLFIDPTASIENVDDKMQDWSFDTIYSTIEHSFQKLKNSGVDGREINKIIQSQIRDTFKEHLGTEETLDKAIVELQSIVDEKIIRTVKKAVDIAKEYIPELEERVYYFLAIHLSTLYERICKGVYKSFQVDIDNIASNYKKEYGIAKILILEIEKNLQTKIPKEEIAMIAMYLRTFSRHEKMQEGKVKIIVLTHGRVASAMVEVANKFLNMNYATSIDVDFNETPEAVLKETIELVEKIDEGKGCLLLVDMGSLVSFGEIITKRTGIKTISIDRVDTAMVLEAVRRAALMDITLDNIVSAIYEDKYLSKNMDIGELAQKKAILFICMTGEGTACSLAAYVKKKFMHIEDEVRLFTIAALNETKLKQNIYEIQRSYHIIAIVGSINPQVKNIPFLSTDEVFRSAGIRRIHKILYTDHENKAVLYKIMDDKLILCNLVSSNKTQVIDKLSQLLVDFGAVSDQFVLSVYKRESIGATYLKGGIGIPHGDSAYVTKTAMAMATLVKPIAWENDFMADLVFLFAFQDRDQKYISEFYDIISNEKALKELKKATSMERIKEILFEKQF
ncbi:transcriptional regulator with AAA-type ATPase domain/transcriptional regulatory protein LevR [Sporomusaceae bacterium BoRhaA]|uniref:sigma 54-interacting transcriptional regulator n=1 Tax=Pelorhabdus rhamnosifermentans TaxID=2772457 RepID=UPI001C06399F|nr:sigma 54-interacting transcriptional regulator [Pelorhabdus rhamnosifermentans]MBU2700201.1 transcriptional regulator with AAA-type ATPase domain/transcriptional regulatory protein LevR [Pelorhabdus rhamnosifermentans]